MNDDRMMAPAPEAETDAEGRPYGPDRPKIPSERREWIGLALTLIVCIVAAVVYFRVTDARGL